MKHPKHPQVLEDSAAASGRPMTETPAAGAPGVGPDSGATEEATGLVGVDAQPLPPPSREEIEALRRERDDLSDQLLRRRADFENYRKRVERDRHQAGIDATAAVLLALLPTLDSFEQALKAGASDEAVRQGLELIYRDFIVFLEAQGVVTLDPAGQRFDPKIHQALCHEVVDGFEEGMVVEVFRKAYFFKDRLLRPALVKVAKGGGEDGEDGRDPEAVH